MGRVLSAAVACLRLGLPRSLAPRAQEPSQGGRPHPACPHYPASAFQLPAPRVQPGLWPRARQLDPSRQLAGGRPALAARRGGRRARLWQEPGGGRRPRRFGGCGRRGCRAGAASPALIGPSPAASAGNCCWRGDWGWRVLQERKGRCFRSGESAQQELSRRGPQETSLRAVPSPAWHGGQGEEGQEEGLRPRGGPGSRAQKGKATKVCVLWAGHQVQPVLGVVVGWWWWLGL